MVVTIGDLVVLTTVVAKKEADPAKDFFPLAVFYQEKFYATGRIPGGFFKREARPTERETLTSRLIDRPIRPMFPENFKNEVQIFSTVMSSDKKQNPDIAAMIGASAALTISGVPFDGPMGAAIVWFIYVEYILNPSFECEAIVSNHSLLFTIIVLMVIWSNIPAGGAKKPRLAI